MIELSELIRDLRLELDRAVAAAAGASVQFELGPVEIEASIAVDRSAGANAKAKFWVMEAGAEASIARSSVQKVKLTLNPRISGTGHAPLVAGVPEPGER